MPQLPPSTSSPPPARRSAPSSARSPPSAHPTSAPTAIRGALARAKLAPDAVQEVFMGNVLSAGIGQAPARQAPIAAGIPNTTPGDHGRARCAARACRPSSSAPRPSPLGDADLVVAGGMESMSNVPYYLEKARTGYRDGRRQDRRRDDLRRPLGPVLQRPHGHAAATSAPRSTSSRASEQDEFAKESFRRALAAQKEGLFDAEIEPVSVPQKKGDPVIVKVDEGPGKGDPTKFASPQARVLEGRDDHRGERLVDQRRRERARPREREGGQGAQARAARAHRRLRRRGAGAGVVHDRAGEGHRRDAWRGSGLKKDEIDLYEINEAFAVVTMVCSKLCGLDPQKVNVRGGAVALGHPIGATGARILTTLLHAMKDRGAKRGLASSASAAARPSPSSSSAERRDRRPRELVALDHALRRAHADAPAGDAHEQLRARRARGAPRRAGDAVRGRAARVDRLGARAAFGGRRRRRDRGDAPPPRSRRAASTSSRASSALPVWAHAETASRVDVPVARRLADGEVIVLDGPVPETLARPAHAGARAGARVPVERGRASRSSWATWSRAWAPSSSRPATATCGCTSSSSSAWRALDARLALPAHGEPIDEPTALFRRYIAHRLMREAKVARRAGLAAGADRRRRRPRSSCPTPTTTCPRPPGPSRCSACGRTWRSWRTTGGVRARRVARVPPR